MAAAAPHIPVLIEPLIEAVEPVRGIWVDGTFGAGGYARVLLEAGAERLVGIDRDPLAHEMAADWLAAEPRLSLVLDTFSNLDDHVSGADGVVLDLGVSSMQLDRAERGFSFMSDGPLDMRMGQEGVSAADLVNDADESLLADILYHYGEERAARRIAKAIVANRPVSGTKHLSEIVEKCLPRSKPGQSHPSTRSFQALRIAVNNEYGELAEGLMAAERALAPGGALAVVTFHSVEDRMVKRFMAERSDSGGGGSRYAPEIAEKTPAFTLLTKKAMGPSKSEVAANPRSRSAKLRVARRTDAPMQRVNPKTLGMPMVKGLRT